MLCLLYHDSAVILLYGKREPLTEIPRFLNLFHSTTPHQKAQISSFRFKALITACYNGKSKVIPQERSIYLAIHAEDPEKLPPSIQ